MVKKVVKKKAPVKKTPVKVIKKTVTTTTITPHKTTKKTKPKRKTTTRRKSTIKIPKDDAKLGKILIENFVGLQKVMVNLSVKFDDLSTKIAKLLELFEISAKALAEKDLTVEKTARDDTRILKKMDNLYEQNRVVARGLTLMHDRLSGESEERIMERDHIPFPAHSEEPLQQAPPQMPFTMPPRKPQMQQPIRKPMVEPEKAVIPNKGSMEGYQKSIVSEPTFKKFPK